MEIIRINRGQTLPQTNGKTEILRKGHLLFSSSSKYVGTQTHRHTDKMATEQYSHKKDINSCSLTHTHTKI